MTLPTIIDLLDGWPGWTPQFDPAYQDELSGLASGKIIVRELGPALWTLTATSRLLKPSKYREWKARLYALENGKRQFYGRDLGGWWPLAYPGGSWPGGLGGFDGTTAAIAEIDPANANRVRIDGLPIGFVFTIGDYFSIPGRNGLYQVVEAAVADGGGETGYFEVRPSLAENVAVDDVVSVTKPSVPMIVYPGSIDPQGNMDGTGTISFRGIQAV